jgi:dihydrodipicolinate synthase/N-acetylneuraminate lyase
MSDIFHKVPELSARFRRGMVIPAMPLALDAARRFDPRRQRALVRYYLDAGAGGLAVGVHTTQFAIRDPGIALFEPVLREVAGTIDAWSEAHGTPVMKIAGICGRTDQALREADFARTTGYHAGLVSLGAFDAGDTVGDMLDHCRAVAGVLPVVGFYLQPAVGGRVLPYAFWRAFAEIEKVVGVKIAPFNRYQTLDVVRAVADAGRAGEVALYTGNDDHIVGDLLTTFEVASPNGVQQVRIVGGLLGHWAVWTRRAVELLEETHALTAAGAPIPAAMLTRAAQITDANAAIFDAANNFAGCIPGIHEVLRRQGLLAGNWTLDPDEVLSPGQKAEIDRVYTAYPWMNDDTFVRDNLDAWMNG